MREYMKGINVIIYTKVSPLYFIFILFFGFVLFSLTCIPLLFIIIKIIINNNNNNNNNNYINAYTIKLLIAS